VAAASTNQYNVDVMGVRCSVTNIDAASREVLDMVRRREGGYVSTCNVHVVVTANRDPEYRTVLDAAALRVPDGWPVAWMQRRQGAKSARRVPGTDLMERLLNVGRSEGLSHYLLGSTQPVLDELRLRVAARYPDVEIAGAYSPPFADLGDGPSAEMVERIRATVPDVVWVGLGAPKQDFWMRMYEAELAPSVLIGVGAAFDFLSGARARAPRWMRSCGLEWAHRLGSEPRRLTRRYLSTNTEFLLRAGPDLIRRGRR
jgi:N-acetylglucosaminyldiphosphoundecaprenol N-acetyl-beta-D-mannosaminyltransferase